MTSPLVAPVCLLTNEMGLTDLEAVQSHIASLISGLSNPLLTQAALRKKVIEMERRTAYKSSWKKFVNTSGLVENVFGILEESYTPFRCKDSNETGFKAARALGGRGTFEWQNFKLRVIEYLLVQGSFNDGEGGFYNFEDTAGGCDEIAWDAGCYLLEHPEWKRE